jgi:integrase
MLPQEQTSAVDDLSELGKDWVRSLRQSNRAPRTVTVYSQALVAFITYLREHNMPTSAPKVDHRCLREFFIYESTREHQRRPGRTVSPAFVQQRYRALQQFFKWLTLEGEIDADPFAKLTPPAVPEKPVPVLSDDQLRALLATCDRREFVGRRDESIIRLLIDSGLRASELMALTVDDLDRPVRVRDKFSVDPHPPCSQVLLDPLPRQPCGHEPVKHRRDLGALVGHRVIMHRRTDNTGRISKGSKRSPHCKRSRHRWGDCRLGIAALPAPHLEVSRCGLARFPSRAFCLAERVGRRRCRRPRLGCGEWGWWGWGGPGGGVVVAV